ncbi:MAG: hypothetical protein GC180_11670 [Bacteroidetes bacterium]|nr:hypothetical protein [Bacteroidota bacterium]
MRGILLCLILLSLQARSQVLITAKLDGKFGLLDSSGNWFMAPKQDSLGTFFHQTVAFNNKGKWGLLHASGRLISPAAWTDISYEEEGKIAVYDGQYWGYIDLLGKTLIAPQFLEADDFHEGLAGASKLEENWGYIDSTGRWFIAPQYTFVAEFEHGLAYVEDDDEAFYINRKGEKQAPETKQSGNYRDITPSGKMGIRKRSGAWLLSPLYDNLSLRSGATYFFYLDGKWGLVDTTNVRLFPNKLDQIRPFSEGLAPVQLNGKWGYMDRQGHMVIPAIFEEARSFSYNRAVVKFNGFFGVIDKGGNFVVSPRFQDILGRFQKLSPDEEAQWEIELD